MMDILFGYGLLLFAPLVFAYAASSDLFTMRISNRVALIFLIAFPLFAYGIGMSWMDALSHLGVGLITFIVVYLLWMFKCIGGGDAKFAAVAAIWLGPELTLWFFALSSIYGALMAIGFTVVRSGFLPGFLVKMEWALRLYTVKRIPYGLALGVAGLQIYAISDWMDAGVRMALS
ncbi:prepilin peptidase [uncultured Cohaesibacter sp.]|uniref:A24 family peptidase n=1 Tax=uncultured Cohaesibacter sp. TaxID=1002546 RepID=UPI0029C61D7F|nr:prepilin peptidase [uncultured Cohaesibacter sp.]